MVNAPLFGLVSKTGVMDKGPLAAAFSEAPALPPRRHADHFMDLYWRYLNPLIPVLDEEFTTRQYRALYEGTPLTEVDEGVFIAILNVVFALSTQLQEHVPTAQREQASSTFFHRAWDLIHPETIIWTPGSLEAVQCLLLICQYLQCTNKPHQTWMAVGIAVRLAQSLKLYVPTGVNTSVDGKRERMRIRVWQSCVYLDRQISASYARPPIVSQRMWAAISDSSNRVPNASFDDQYFAKSLEALDIIQPLLSWNPGLKTLGGFEVGSGFPESLSMHEQCIRAAQLERDLAEWERNLPRWLVLGSEDSQLNHGTQSQAVILRLRYLHGRIILLRPILTQLCLSKPPYDLSTEPRLTESLIRDCCHSCIDDAAEVISVVSTHSQPRTGGTLPAIPWWTRLFYLYVASTVIITALRPIDTFRTAKVMESWEGIISTLRAHESLSHHVQHLIEMLISISMMSRDPGHLRPTVGDEGTSGISQNPMLPHDTFGLDNLDYGWDETFWMEAITPWK
ncbi:fungal-specific transcription factor domain-containing protein [Xylariales sp. PMI_506]|nr:fungal-specific transcription factor domain-containing protein [Xylariales sp. PMI_506]